MTLVDQRPDSAPPRPWRFPSFERTRLDSGLQLLVCHQPGRPLAAARLVLDGGAITEPAGRAGVALLAARALPEGTESLDAFELAEAMEGMGAEIRGEVSYDSMQVRMDVPVTRLGPALALFGDVVRRPGFRPGEVERLRKERLDQLAQEQAVPGALAARAFEGAVFVADSPYARSIGGQVETVEGLDTAAIESFYRSRIDASAATLVVVGDVAGVDIAGIAADAFGQWPVDNVGQSTPVVDARDEPTRVVLVDRAGSVQSTLTIGHAGPPRRTPDYVPIDMLAMCLGGVFGSRLNLKLREEKGYTYGAFAGFDFRRHGGTFSAQTAVQTEVTADAVADAVAEIARTAESGIPEEELASTREYSVGVFPIAYERPDAVAHGLADLVVHGLADDWHDSVRSEMAAVSSEQVTKAAADHLHPDRMAIVVVGDAAAVRPGLEAAGLGSVEVREAGV